MTKTMRAMSPFQQVISKTSEHQRRFERITTTLPSCRRPLRRPEWRWRRSPCRFMIRRRACGWRLACPLRLAIGSRDQGAAIAWAVHEYVTSDDADPEGYADKIAVLLFHKSAAMRYARLLD
jgi:hypothetical protein